LTIASLTLAVMAPSRFISDRLQRFHCWLHPMARQLSTSPARPVVTPERDPDLPRNYRVCNLIVSTNDFRPETVYDLPQKRLTFGMPMGAAYGVALQLNLQTLQDPRYGKPGRQHFWYAVVHRRRRHNGFCVVKAEIDQAWQWTPRTERAFPAGTCREYLTRVDAREQALANNTATLAAGITGKRFRWSVPVRTLMVDQAADLQVDMATADVVAVGDSDSTIGGVG
jgi:hypothetical protein